VQDLTGIVSLSMIFAYDPVRIPQDLSSAGVEVSFTAPGIGKHF